MARWATQGLSRRPGSSAEALRVFERKYKVQMPEDLRELLMVADGMEEMDTANQIRLWSLQEIAPVSEAAPELASDRYAGYFVFADHCLWSMAYGIYLAAAPAVVVVAGGPGPIAVTSSFSSFLELYLDDSAGLFPSPPKGG